MNMVFYFVSFVAGIFASFFCAIVQFETIDAVKAFSIVLHSTASLSPLPILKKFKFFFKKIQLFSKQPKFRKL